MAESASDMTNVDEMIDDYRARAEPLGVWVERVADVDAAAEVVRAWAEEIGAADAVIAPSLRERAAAMVGAIERTGLATRPGGAPAEIRDAPLGISLAARAVAETGSVLLVEGDLADRAVSLVTLTHITVCPISALVASLDDAVPVFRAAADRSSGGTGYATLVTGPSRTADIELTLTVGVQGPGRVMILFVDDLS